MDTAIDRAFQGFEKLLSAELRTIGAELRAINQRLSRVDALETTVDGIDTRVIAAETFISSHERRLNETEDKVAVAIEVERRLTAIEGGKRDLKAWLWNQAPSLTIAAAALFAALFAK
jgi:predicted  nucleic acid-binding Zn-ribbon protein